MKTQEYLVYLKGQYDKLSDPIEKSVFYLACKKFQDYKAGKLADKQITKETILLDLIDKGIIIQKGTKLPDDRPVRRAARELLKRGYPIMADSTEKGYCIVETVKEIDLPQKQNYDRAINILAVDKGYNIVRQMLGGQELLREVN
ncbi:MAG: hypothetical protein NC548_51525 [Lachnospiraceae bacterium]|nr:hypothetical protein [Lachnospiraceae bacterium]